MLVSGRFEAFRIFFAATPDSGKRPDRFHGSSARLEMGIFSNETLLRRVSSAEQAPAELIAAFRWTRMEFKIGGGSGSGLPDFSWHMIPKPDTMHQMNTKLPEWSRNIPKVRKILQMD
jgi:hypothetical protein